jgi:ProP effector
MIHPRDMLRTFVHARLSSMNMPSIPSTPSPISPARALLKEFQQNFPAFRDCMPLAIGIDKQIIARLPEIDRKVLRITLGIHTKSLRYLRQMEKATVRFDLDGNAAEEITELHRTHTAKILQERIKQDAEHRKAKREAEQKAVLEAQEAEALRQRTEKLNQLAAKFSSHGA